MKIDSKYPSWLLAVHLVAAVALCLVTGCTTVGTDAVAEGSVRTSVVASPSVRISRPSVRRVGGETVIAGTVTRAGDGRGRIDGVARVIAALPDGRVVASWDASLTDRRSGRRRLPQRGEYEVRYPGALPPGTTVDVGYAGT